MSALWNVDWSAITMAAPKEFSKFLTQQVISVGVNVGVAQVSVLAVIAFLQGVGILSLGQEVARVVYFLTAANLASAPILKRRLLSPKIANPTCNVCSSKRMTSTGLVCLDCGATVGPPRAIKDLMEKKE